MRNFMGVFGGPQPALRRLGTAGLALTFSATLMNLTAFAQEAPSAPPATATEPPAEAGRTMIEDGAQLLLRGLLSEMEPKLRELDEKWQKLAPQLEAIGPQLSAAAKLMGDLQNYQMPEMLPNGDILIRRKLIDNLPPPPVPPSPLPPAPRAPGLETEL